MLHSKSEQNKNRMFRQMFRRGPLVNTKAV
ncbi:MAG: hypothetical protein ACJATG_001469 [Dinoroseobacter sp.]